MRYMTMIAILAVAGCTTAKPIYGPDGRQGFALTCNGSLNSWGSCMEKAGALCKESGYDTFLRNTETGQVTAINYTPGVGLNGYSGPMFKRELIVSCRK